jgi:hypothetical protein
LSGRSDPGAAAGRHDPPDVSVNNDRRADPGADTAGPGGVADAAWHVGVIVHPPPGARCVFAEHLDAIGCLVSLI